MARTRYQGPERQIPLRDLPASALRAVLREGYRSAHFKNDLLAGVVVGIVALPLAMALAVAVGVAPQAGLYTAIVAGFVTAALGGSRTQVTGPTAAFVVVLAPIYSKFGLGGLLLSGLFGGFLLIAMGLLRLGKLIHFVPHPVTTGFTAGIATVIAVLQFKDLLGLAPTPYPEHFPGKAVALASAWHTIRVEELFVGLATLVLLILAPKMTRRVPAPLLVLPIAALGAAIWRSWSPEMGVDTVADRFGYFQKGSFRPGIPQELPSFVLPWRASDFGGSALDLDFETFRALFMASFAVAMLGAIESLLSAVIADAMARTRHDPDSELIAQGIGNIIAPFFGGIAATGAIARTATNVKTGARSPIAAMAHSITILATLLLLAPLLGFLPMASLAALLLVVAWNMSEAHHVVHVLRVAPKSDVAVLLVCFFLTIGFDMVVGVSVGMVLASFLFMRRMAEVTHLTTTSIEGESGEVFLPEGAVLYEISGPLFFGAAQKAMAALEIVDSGTRVVIVEMSRATAMDATGLVAFESAVRTLTTHGCATILVNVQPQPRKVLARAGFENGREVYFSENVVDAVAQARVFLKASAHPKRLIPAGSSTS